MALSEVVRTAAVAKGSPLSPSLAGEVSVSANGSVDEEGSARRASAPAVVVAKRSSAGNYDKLPK